MSRAHEVNFDGLVGPTHNYAGLSHGNVASMAHRGATSNPRQAALQGLAKMKFLADLGVPQAVLPPHERPSIAALRALGFTGRDDAAILRAAAKSESALLAACSSASGMWVANAATVTPSADSADGRVHFTPANLVSKFHRLIEPPQTTRTLRAIFRDSAHFVVHDPILGGQALGDEGAANHTRFTVGPDGRGLNFFVYGHAAFRGATVLVSPERFPSRQALEAFRVIQRRHLLAEKSTVFAQQNPAAIDAGVFHNDVISVGHENVFLYHEQAFVDTPSVIDQLGRRYAAMHRGGELVPIRVSRTAVPLVDAVGSYLFNSQLVTVAPGRMALIAPQQCAETPRVKAFLDRLIARGHTPVKEVHYLDLRQSMHNGGGPACLRLRIVLTPAERALLPPRVFLDDTTYAALTAWVKKYYRDELRAADLADSQLLDESRRALDKLTQFLGLGAIYPFQRFGSTKADLSHVL